MAEMHPILWSRISDRRLSSDNVKVVVMSTFEHRSFELADVPIVFNPHADLAILNYIANYIIQNDKVNLGLRLTNTPNSNVVKPILVTVYVQNTHLKLQRKIVNCR